MTVLNGILSTIIYSPLIIIGLLIIYAIAYGLWHYKTTGDIPETYSTTFSIIKYVLIKLLLPLKMLGQFFWWLLPIFPEKYREPMGYVKYGAWDRVNIARTGLLLTLIGFITTTILIYNYGYPNMLVSWYDIKGKHYAIFFRFKWNCVVMQRGWEKTKASRNYIDTSPIVVPA